MAQQVGRGGTIVLSAEYKLSDGTLVDPVSPLVDILDPSNTEVVSNAVPTNTAVGQYEYSYAVDAAATLGTWTAHWAGTINGNAVIADETFIVVSAGFIGFPSDGPSQSTCEPWAAASDIKGACQEYSFAPEDVEEALQVATDILYQLSGQRFSGVCSKTVRPCCRPYDGACGCWSGSSCGYNLHSVDLTPTPVTAILEVKVDGVSVDPTLYRVDNFRSLVKLPDDDGTITPWPCSQDLSLADTEQYTFSVSFTHGTLPPPPGKRAAAILACELLLSGNPAASGKCRLPQRVQSVTRQGVSMMIMDPMTLVQDGKTGIGEIDLFLSAYNPSSLRRRAVAYNIDMHPMTRRTDT